MKHFLCFTGILFFSKWTAAQQSTDSSIYKSFNLSYISVGMGSNMWDTQPVVRVAGSHFIYTSEQVWKYDGEKTASPDTIMTGNLRLTSIDSILNLLKELKSDTISKVNLRVMSGGIIYLSISNSQRKISFNLHNANDLIAEKIIDILNSHIPDRYRKLWIPKWD